MTAVLRAHADGGERDDEVGGAGCAGGGTRDDAGGGEPANPAVGVIPDRPGSRWG